MLPSTSKKELVLKNAKLVFRYLLDAASRGEKAALLTVTGIIGHSAREAGTQMAVSETGGAAGSFSGGCVEAAIIGEARRVIAAGQAELLRYGQGSPFIDMRLPCGGGMDVLVSPVASAAPILQAYELLEARQPVALLLGRDGSLLVQPGGKGTASGWRNDLFLVQHMPDLRLIIAGQGAETSALARLAVCFGADVTVLSPEKMTAMAAAQAGAEAWELAGRQRSAHLHADPYTAVVMLLHDHDRETELLLQALEQAPFFIGAMGSRATHARRLDALAARGVPSAALKRIVGPIGTIHAARDPETLALSALTQIVTRYRESLTVLISVEM
ncbi:MAG TPA: XdhC family protein [Acetobacteraceae bacterium]|nr:XdhC family protein [Acetobacteraceae bacterium]